MSMYGNDGCVRLPGLSLMCDEITLSVVHRFCQQLYISRWLLCRDAVVCSVERPQGQTVEIIILVLVGIGYSSRDLDNVEKKWVLQT